MKKLVVFMSVVAVAVAGFMHYMGMFSNMEPEEKVMGPYTIAYESFVGDYSKTGPVFDRVNKALEAEGFSSTKGLGIYYDDPKTTPREQLRSECGSVIEEKDLAKIEALRDKYKFKTLPREDSLVVSFPVKNSLSYMFGPMKAYPALARYAKEHGYKMTGTYELYDMPSKMIYFVMTYSK